MEGIMAIDKREKFINLAEKRVNNAIKSIKIIGNLANKKNYDYEESHVKQILTAIEKEIKDLKGKFSSTESGNSQEFKFKN